MSCWKSAGIRAEPELLRALCSVSQPQAPVSLPAPATARLWLWPFPPCPAFPRWGFPSLGLHLHRDSLCAELRRGSAKESILGSSAQSCGWKWGEGRVNPAQLLAHRQQAWSSFWGSFCITTAAKICVILPHDLTRAHKGSQHSPNANPQIITCKGSFQPSKA